MILRNQFSGQWLSTRKKDTQFNECFVAKLWFLKIIYYKKHVRKVLFSKRRQKENIKSHQAFIKAKTLGTPFQKYTKETGTILLTANKLRKFPCDCSLWYKTILCTATYTDQSKNIMPSKLNWFHFMFSSDKNNCKFCPLSLRLPITSTKCHYDEF